MALTRIRVLNQQSTYNVDRLNANTLVVGGNNITGASGAGGGIVISSVVYLAANGTPLIANAAPTTGNSVIKIIGSGFAANANVFLNGLLQPSANVTFVDSTELRLNMPALASNTYSLMTFNAAGSGAVYYSGVRFDPYPIWTTGGYSVYSAPISTQLLVTGYGSGSISFSVASGNTLPSGLTLAANGILSGTTTEGTYNFYVNAIDSENEITTQQITLTVSFADPYFQYTTLLLSNSAQGSNGTNAFIDSSNNNFTVTNNGTPYQGTFSPFPAIGTWSNYFNGGSNYLSGPSNAAFNFGTGDFTIECWYYLMSSPTNLYLFDIGTNGTRFQLYNNTIYLQPQSGNWLSSSSVGINQNTWYHAALVRQSGTLYGYINGVSIGSTTNTNSLTNTQINIGTSGAADYSFIGHLSNLRIIKGTAVYPSGTTFTPSTTPLTAVANTSLLTCQANRFIDNSTNAFTITPTGNPNVQRFNPFGNNKLAYSTSTNGGSISLGSSSYLSIPYSVNFNFPGNFTVELWFNFFTTPAAAAQTFVSNYSTGGSIGWALQFRGESNNVFRFGYGNTTIVDSTSQTIISNTWYHLAVTRTASTITLFLNGVSIGSTTNATSFESDQELWVGGLTNIGQYFPGYISNLRIVKGTALYTSAFTLPTTPLTAIANTQLLLLGTNGRIIDNTNQNHLRLFGDAKVSSSAIKYGTGSMYFDGTGDWIVSNSNNSNALGGGDLTVECWVNVPSISGGYAAIIADSEYGNSNYGWAIYQNGSNLEVWALGQIVGASSVLTINTWIHIAWTRSGSSNKLFINGTSVATATNSTSYIGTRYWIGARGPGATSGLYPFTGYIDDVRITNGYARYTANTAAPSGPPILY